jgi:phosphoribosylaminoimidazole-succinocarboxamide synthase
MKEIVDAETAAKLKDLSLRIYERARDLAGEKGIIIADTKMEFGIHPVRNPKTSNGEYNNEIILIDELLTPDSSRFWSTKDYAQGRSQDSFDKQIVRDYLLTLGWDRFLRWTGTGLRRGQNFRMT